MTQASVVDSGTAILAAVRGLWPPDDRVRYRRHGMDISAVTSLTPRELQVIEGVARGMTLREIATLLAISIKTVEATASHAAQRRDESVREMRFALDTALVAG